MRFPFDPDGELIVVPARFRGSKGSFVARMALDTGATRSLISWHALIVVGYDPAKEQNKIAITTGSGVEFAPLVTIKTMEALGHLRRRFPVLCHNLPPSATVDGLLGLDFLRKKRLGINFKRGYLTLN